MIDRYTHAILSYYHREELQRMRRAILRLENTAELADVPQLADAIDEIEIAEDTINETVWSYFEPMIGPGPFDLQSYESVNQMLVDVGDSLTIADQLAATATATPIQDLRDAIQSAGGYTGTDIQSDAAANPILYAAQNGTF